MKQLKKFQTKHKKSIAGKKSVNGQLKKPIKLRDENGPYDVPGRDICARVNWEKFFD